jgi:hypothetical protein
MEDLDHLDKYEFLLKILTEKIEIDGKEISLKEEFEKFFIRGNKSAGTRIRKVMQILRRSSEDIRNDIQSYKKTL